MGKVYLTFIDKGHAGLKNKIADPNATPGKESPYIKSLGRKIQEEEFNAPTASFLKEELKRSGVHVYMVADDVYDTSLKQRTDYANKTYYQYCDKYGAENVVAIYISIHFDAFDGTFDGHNPEGFSIHIYPGHINKDAGRLAKNILTELKGGTKQVNRGIKENKFWVVSESNMPAVLIEHGFMDNPREALLMLDESFQKECAIEEAKGACKYFGIPYIGKVDIEIEKDKNIGLEGEIMEQNFSPSVGAIRNSVSTVLRRLENKDPALADRWRKEFISGEMTISDAVGLLYVAIDRGYIVGDKGDKQ